MKALFFLFVSVFAMGSSAAHAGLPGEWLGTGTSFWSTPELPDNKEFCKLVYIDIPEYAASRRLSFKERSFCTGGGSEPGGVSDLRIDGRNLVWDDTGEIVGSISESSIFVGMVYRWSDLSGKHNYQTIETYSLNWSTGELSYESTKEEYEDNKFIQKETRKSALKRR